jgi:DNA-binding transcriptional ArsR family regulator
MPPRNAARALKDSAPVFAALGDETRLRLVARLCDQGPLSITRLTEGENVTRQAITKHLHVLAEAGLVHGTRDGRENVWQLEPRRLEEARRCLDRISQQWDDALDRLRDLVER